MRPKFVAHGGSRETTVPLASYLSADVEENVNSALTQIGRDAPSSLVRGNASVRGSPVGTTDDKLE